MSSFSIMGSYQGIKEELDTADSKGEAIDLVKEYLTAFKGSLSVWYELKEESDDE